MLGNSFWAFSANLTWIHGYDPVVLFYGVGTHYRLPNDFVNDTLYIEPGVQFNYQLGVGFALNNHITLSTAFLGSYITEDYVNDFRLAGGALDLRLRFAATIGRPCNRIVEPFAEIGMTQDAPDAHRHRLDILGGPLARGNRQAAGRIDWSE